MIILAITAALAAAGFALAGDPSRRVTVYPSERIVVDGRPRTFRLVVPRGSDRERLPVVFHFHGHGNTPESEADRTKLDHLAASQRLVLVYPAAIRGNWRTRAADSTRPADNSDVRFFDALLDDLTTRCNIDRSRVYLTGMSMGAGFVHQLGLARSREIAAAVAHSGAAPRRLRCDRPFPILIVTGANESMRLPTALDDMRRYRQDGHPCELLIVQGIGHQWAVDRNMQMWRFLAEHRLDE